MHKALAVHVGQTLEGRQQARRQRTQQSGRAAIVCWLLPPLYQLFVCSRPARSYCMPSSPLLSAPAPMRSILALPEAAVACSS